MVLSLYSLRQSCMILSLLPQNLVVSPLLFQNYVVLFLSLQNRMVLSLLHQSCLILALFLSPQNLVVLSSFTSEPHGPLSIYLLQNLVGLLFPSEPHGLLLSPPKPCGPPPSMAAAPRFKSQRPSSCADPFPTPPTISYTCQHPSILPALLGCHSKSGQV